MKIIKKVITLMVVVAVCVLIVMASQLTIGPVWTFLIVLALATAEIVFIKKKAITSSSSSDEDE